VPIGVTKRYPLALLCSALALAAITRVVLAAPRDYNEQEAPGPTPDTGVSAPLGDDGPTRRGLPTTIDHDRNGEAPSATTAPLPAEESGAEEAHTAARKPTVTGFDNGDIAYVVRSGETLGAIAAMFHVDAADLAHANRLRADDELLSGQRLRVPNPFAGQDKALKGQVQRLSDEIQQFHQKIEAAEGEKRRLQSSSSDLTAELQESRHDAETLPWWRNLAYAGAVISVVLVGLALLMLFDWLLLRRRFRTLAQMNESLRRLDQKYKEILAKAELRFQQLYGRRRTAVGQNEEFGKIPEEYEIDRLNQELREILENNLERLGPAPGIQGKKRELSSGSNVTADVRSSRR
jgi:LysM repeat protein